MSNRNKGAIKISVSHRKQTADFFLTETVFDGAGTPILWFFCWFARARISLERKYSCAAREIDPGVAAICRLALLNSRFFGASVQQAQESQPRA